MVQPREEDRPLDRCQVCKGLLGGVRGNENLKALSNKVGDVDCRDPRTYVRVCDQCDSLHFHLPVRVFASREDMITAMRKEWRSFLKKVFQERRERQHQEWLRKQSEEKSS